MKAFLVIGFVFCGLTANAAICGSKDDRILSRDPMVGRLSKPKTNSEQNTACTVTLISDKCVITASTCVAKGNASQVEFNTPESVNSIMQPANAKDTYMVDPSFVKMNDTVKIGENWAVLKLKANAVTGLLPGKKQGFYKVAMNVKYPEKEAIRVVEYGYSNVFDFPVADGDKKNYAQKTAYGYLKKGGTFLIANYMTYVASNTSPGSPVISQRTNEVLGIGTHGGCERSTPYDTDLSNSGTFIYGNSQLKSAIKACLAE